MRLRKWLGGFVLVVALALVAIQFVPVERTNPPARGETPSAPPEVASVLRKACFDCHSNETRWPWYSRVAPVSWLVADDVREGRKHLNFSEWSLLDRSSREGALREIHEMVEEGEMPLAIYRLAHPEARLTDEEKAALLRWAER